MKKILSASLFCFALNLSAQQIDTIRVGHKFKNIKNLEIGKTKDIIYTKVGDKVMSVSINLKETKVVRIADKEFLQFSHNVINGNTDFNGSFEYICEPETLKPVQLIRNSKRAGKEAFQFNELLISGLDSATDNKQKDFSLALNEPTYNWQIDLETYSLLPMKKGYHAVMNFYHPAAQTPPKYYHLKVIGSEELVLADKRKMDCWIVFTDYGGTQPSRFWFTKKGQNFVKMEGQYNRLTILKERIY